MILGQVGLCTAPISVKQQGIPWADTVPQERLVYVVAEIRTLAVPSEPEYTVVIPAVPRVIKIPPDRDMITIRESV